MSQPWWPTTADVAALLTARTTNEQGVELGDFTAATRPTGGQVLMLIEQSAALVNAVIGDATVTLGTVSADALRSLVALRTAMAVELSYFPEQVGTDTSPFEALQSLYRDEFSRVTTAVDEAITPEDTSGGTTQGYARYRFPLPSDPLRF